jgi:hypothetical protein
MFQACAGWYAMQCKRSCNLFKFGDTNLIPRENKQDIDYLLVSGMIFSVNRRLYRLLTVSITYSVIF